MSPPAIADAAFLFASSGVDATSTDGSIGVFSVLVLASSVVADSFLLWQGQRHICCDKIRITTSEFTMSMFLFISKQPYILKTCVL